MGWNSWDCYGTTVDEKTIRANAEYMAANLKKYGYEYVVCDIQWYEDNVSGFNYNKIPDLIMDEYSRLIPSEKRFPSSAGGKGFAPLAEYVHSLGLKFGIHIMRGIPRSAVEKNMPVMCDGVNAADIADRNSYCPWNPNMYGVDYTKKGAQEYYNSLFELYASWGVDFVKCDDIANTELFPENPYSARKEIEMLRAAINACGRDIILSLSPGPAPVEEHAHLAEYADMWRITGDFWDEWDKVYAMFAKCLSWQGYVKEGAWPDCDMLPFGRIALCDNEGAGRYTRLTQAEIRTVMTLWCIFRSPLIIGSELNGLDDFTLSVLTNEELLDMHRNSFNGRQTVRNEKDGSGEIIWQADGKNCRYTALFNTGSTERKIGFYVGNETVHDMWKHEDIDTDGLIDVEPHGVVMLRLEKK